MAAQGEAIDQGHEVEYLTLENRSVLARCVSSRVPFDWMINPYRGCEFGCKYCYARYTHEFMELRDGMDFERKIYVKQHTGWLLRQELTSRRSVCDSQGQHRRTVHRLPGMPASPLLHGFEAAGSGGGARWLQKCAPGRFYPVVHSDVNLPSRFFSEMPVAVQIAQYHV